MTLCLAAVDGSRVQKTWDPGLPYATAASVDEVKRKTTVSRQTTARLAVLRSGAPSCKLTADATPRHKETNWVSGGAAFRFMSSCLVRPCCRDNKAGDSSSNQSGGEWHAQRGDCRRPDAGRHNTRTSAKCKHSCHTRAKPSGQSPKRRLPRLQGVRLGCREHHTAHHRP